MLQALESLSGEKSALKTEIQSWRAQGQLQAGEFREAIAIAEEALQEIQEGVDGEVETLRGRLLLVLGQALVYVGDLDASQEQFAQARAAFEEEDAVAEIALVDNAMGLAYHRQAKYADAAEVYRAAMNVFEEMGNRTRQGSALMNMAVILQEQGEYGRAMERYQQAHALAEILGDHAGVLRVTCNLGNLHLHMGDLEASRRNVSHSLSLCQKEGNRMIEGYNWTILGEISRMEGAYSEADTSFKKAEALFQDLECFNELAQVTLERAQLALTEISFQRPRPWVRKHIGWHPN